MLTLMPPHTLMLPPLLPHAIRHTLFCAMSCAYLIRRYTLDCCCRAAYYADATRCFIAAADAAICHVMPPFRYCHDMLPRCRFHFRRALLPLMISLLRALLFFHMLMT